MEYLPIVSAILALISLSWLGFLTWRLNKFTRGRNAKNLEGAIVEMIANLQNLERAKDQLAQKLAQHDQRIRRKIHHIRTVRFNPFADQGGDHSFATALLDEDGNGVVLSSLFSRDRVNVFAKPVATHHSQYELSHEEKMALAGHDE